MASLIGGIFGRAAARERAGEALRAAYARFGRRRGRRVFNDFRSLNDPEAPVTTPRRFAFPDPKRRCHGGRRRGPTRSPSVDRARGVLDAARSRAPGGSRRRRPRAAAGRAVCARAAGLRRPQASNATLVARRRLKSGPAARGDRAAGRPTTRRRSCSSWTSTAAGIDARGVAFPGISLYILLGRGKDFSWSATTATTDNVDEFVEELCEPERRARRRGSRPLPSTRAECIPMTVQRAHAAHARPVGGRPGRHAARHHAGAAAHRARPGHAHGDGQGAAGRDRRGALDLLPRARLDARLQAAQPQRGDRRALVPAHDGHDQLPLQLVLHRRARHRLPPVGLVPAAGRGHRPVLPTWGTGEHDWRGFDPGTFDSARAGFKAAAQGHQPEARLHRQLEQQAGPGLARGRRRLFTSGRCSAPSASRTACARRIAGGGKIDLPKLVSIMGDAGTVDLRGQEVYPLAAPRDRQAARRRRTRRLLGAARRVGRARLAPASTATATTPTRTRGAVALMDAWWEPLVRGDLRAGARQASWSSASARVDPFDQAPGPGGSSFFDGWYGYVEKDLRTLLGRTRARPVLAPLLRRRLARSAAAA